MMRLFYISFQYAKGKFINSTTCASEISEHWNEIEIKLNAIKYNISENVSKMDIIVNDSKRIPSIIIPSRMLKFVGEIEVDINISWIGVQSPP